MGYSNYKKIKTVCKKFKIEIQMAYLFNDIAPQKPSAWLTETLRKANLTMLTNEKAKAERIISPILIEVVEPFQNRISLFSGENLEVRPSDDLSGECDFFFALQPPKPFIDAPIITLVEAKDEDMEWGLAQCAAQIYGAKIFNETEGKPLNTLFGCATTGIEWQFIKFENNTYSVDYKIYTDLNELLGVWNFLLRQYTINAIH